MAQKSSELRGQECKSFTQNLGKISEKSNKNI